MTAGSVIRDKGGLGLMSIVVILKFFHFLGLFVAGGIGVGGAIVQSAHIKAGQPPAPPVGRAMQILGLLGLISLIVIWLTGIGLAHSLYGGLAINSAFTAKLGGAALLLLLSAASNFHIYQAMKAKHPPHASFMKASIMLSRAALIVVLAGAAIAFSS